MPRSSASARPLTDHEEIRRWAEERGAQPACVRGTGGGEDVGMIRLDFPGYSGAQSLEPIEWDDWFDKFDESNLALMVQDETARGQKSNFNKLVSRRTAEQGGRRRSSARRATTSARSQTGRRQSRSRGSSTGARSGASRSQSGRNRTSSAAKHKVGPASGLRRGGAEVLPQPGNLQFGRSIPERQAPSRRAAVRSGKPLRGY